MCDWCWCWLCWYVCSGALPFPCCVKDNPPLVLLFVARCSSLVGSRCQCRPDARDCGSGYVHMRREKLEVLALFCPTHRGSDFSLRFSLLFFFLFHTAASTFGALLAFAAASRLALSPLCHQSCPLPSINQPCRSVSSSRSLLCTSFHFSFSQLVTHLCKAAVFAAPTGTATLARQMDQMPLLTMADA